MNNICSANASIDLTVGNRYWTTRNGANPNSGTVEISSALALGNVSSGIVFAGSPTSSAITGPESAVVAEFNVSMYNINLVPNDTLPQAIPTGAALAAGNANQSFMVAGGDGTAIFSYTGQSCATPPPAGPPMVTPSGIVPLFSTATTIKPGSWVSIFGTNLAGVPTTWSPATTFPTSLGGTSVTIDGRPAYLWYVSPTQINLQVPDDNATGSVNVVVTTGGGMVNSSTTLGQFGPSFSLLDTKHVAGIILRNDGSGTQGGGSYDIIGPTGTTLGYQTVAARAGDMVELYGIGFGPTSPAVPSGQVYSGAAPTTNPVKVMINNTAVTPLFAGITSAGLYQINLAIPSGLGTGDVPLIATVGALKHNRPS